MDTVRHFVSDLDLSSQEQSTVLNLALDMKRQPEKFRQTLAGKMLGMVFQKSSTRTRVSFECGIAQLGGQGLFLSARDIQMGRGEPITDTGAVLSRYLDLIMIRTFAHADVQALAAASSVPVINGLDDLLHPCQALTDLMTLLEKRGTLKGQQLVYVGDGNNMAHSLLLAGARAGVHVRIVAPADYLPSQEVLRSARDHAQATGAKLEATSDLDGVCGADAVYTDVWASMGQEEETAQRKRAFAAWQVNENVMRRAKPDAIFLHCLPAHRGEEVASEVIDGPQSVVFDQAENRLHAQKALMAFLCGAV